MNDQERRKELAHFLRTRRARLLPEAIGLPAGSRRRTPGLRREELAVAAGISVTWYTGLEQGRPISVSVQILERLAQVLQLNVAERSHLFLLAHQYQPTESSSFSTTVSPALQSILENVGAFPAYIVNPRWDLLAWNQPMARVYHTNFEALSFHERNILRLTFSHPSRCAFLPNWEGDAQALLALFRASTERYIGETWRSALITELERVSPQFRAWWSRHDIQSAHTTIKEFHHPLVGRLTFQPTTFQVTDIPDLRMTIYTPQGEAQTAQKLAQLMAE